MLINMKEIKERIIGGVALLWLLLLTSCVSEELFEQHDPSPEGKVRLQLRLLPAAAEEGAQTQSTAHPETAIDPARVYVLVTDQGDAHGVLRQRPVKASAMEENQIYATLLEETLPSYVHVLANVSTAHAAYLEGLVGTEKLSDIQAALTLDPPSAAGLSSPFPMEGVSGQFPSLLKGSTLPTSIPLVRAVARIDVDARTVAASDFQMVGARLVNAARNGWLFQPPSVPAQQGADVMAYETVSTVVDNAITRQMYCYENGGKAGAFAHNPTRVVVEGKYKGATTSSFYGIDIAYKVGTADSDPLLYDIARNFIYTVHLTKVNRDGYATYQEAARSAPFNAGIEANITVTDPYAHNIVTNGKQYMGTTNTTLVVYPLATNTPVKYVTAAILSYTTDPGWEQGEIVATDGITFVSNATSREVLSLSSGSTPVVREVQINLPADFTTGTLKAHIGNLSQTIVVRKHSPLPPAGEVLLDFAKGSDYVVGEVIAPSAATAWLKVSSDEEGLKSSSLLDKVTNPSGKIYIHVASNVDFNGTATARTAQLFIASKSEEQRTRVYVEQGKIDVYTENNTVAPYTYVGTFHRWNQTAERLIRIKATQSDAEVTGSWSATVVYGNFIVLSTSPSKDPGIKSYSPHGEPTAVYTTDESVEAHCQVTDGKRSVHGIIDTATPHIYFKVGLTGKLSSPSSPPRYGLIAITYNRTATQFIYVRQGEEADYLMRPHDPVVYLPINNVTGPNYIKPEVRHPMNDRAYARKLAIYNLKSTSSLVGLSDKGRYGHTFVRYPSQAGDYYFQTGTASIAQGTTGSLTISTEVVPPATSPTYFRAADWETCPTGYRRISDGVNSGANGWISSANGRVSDSENRQSYWLFPMKGNENSNFSNQVKGYLADGYFDRREITKVGDYQSVVGYLSREAAFWGYLVFNPYNYASVFLPVSGHFNSKGSRQVILNSESEFGGFLTSTFEGGNNVWLTNYGVSRSKEVFDNYTSTGGPDGYALRCVRNENPPVLIPGDGVTVDPFPGGEGNELIAARIEYSAGGTLAQQLTKLYTAADIPKINSLTISGSQSLTEADFAYLNQWADASADVNTNYRLQHLVLRGAGTKTIPARAFTSVHWKSIALQQVATIADGAFDLNMGAGLYNLVLGAFDPITVSSAAFGANVRTANITLTLSGEEYANRVDRTATPHRWRELEWKLIKEQK